jgi:hypothetical protein
MFVARSYRAHTVGLLGVVDVIHILYLAFLKATVKIMSIKCTSPNQGNIYMFYVNINLLPSLQ